MADIIVDPADIVHSQGGLLIVDSTTGSGTGNYDSFLRIQANNDETGYNTEASNQLDNKDGIWTHSLLISDLQAVTYNGETYYEIRLDLNEVQSGTSANITLDDLKLFVGPAAGGSAFPTFSGLTLKFDLSGTVGLVDNETGSGTDDYQILIPASMLTGGDYLTLYADFSGSSDGFEEFRALTTEFVPQPDIGILKETAGTDDECPNLITGGSVTWTYTVENNGNVPIENVVVTDDAGTPGGSDGPGGDPLDDDDFHPNPVLSGGFNIGDTNHNNILDVTETWQYTYTGTVQAGEYENIATVAGVYDDGTLTGQAVSGFEEDCYNGVTPTIQIVKSANGADTDCKTILVGEDVVYTYAVTNTSAAGITIDNVTVVDDNATPGGNDGPGGDPLDDDDFSPDAVLQAGETHNVGDINDNDILDLGETWQYTYTVAAIAGEQENTATVNGTAHDIANNTAPVSDDDEACYFGADPSIDIVKKTNGTDDLCPVVGVGETVTWTYFVKNTGNVALTNISLSDDNGTPGGNDGPGGDPLDDDDFVPTAVLDLGGHNVGDINDDGIFDPNEIWEYSATGVAEEGHYDNIATVTADFTDDFQNSVTVDASEDDCYVGVEGPGVRTPGFWSNPRNGGEFWDGNFAPEKHAGEDCFPFGELTRTDTNGNGVLDSGDAATSLKVNNVKGLLIGDWDLNGVQNGTEDTLFISLDAAKLLINASLKEQQDGRYVVGRDLVATWLNYLAGNPIGAIDSDTNYDPKEAIQDAIDYLQVYGDNTNHDGILATANGKSIIWEGAASVVKQGTANWANIGSPIHEALDEYNNSGGIDGIGYAHTCDTPQFVALMTGFQTDHDLFVM